MEICPKVYFKVNKNYGVMVPVSGIISKIDKEFLKPEVLDANKKGYNDYTRDFIHNCDKSDVFYSESYNYDPKNFTFNFDEINICNDNFKGNVGKT